MNSMRVGFVGLGDMGGPIARRIIDAGFQTNLWARREVALKPFLQTSFTRVPDLGTLGRISDIVGVCVFGDDDVREILLGEEGILAGMNSGGIVLIHSTISVETCEELETVANKNGISVLDAPVSGARQGAIEGTLGIMVGGKQSAFDKALPVLRAYGGTVRLMGPIGSGQKMKVLNNVVGFCNGSIAAMAINIGDGLSLDRSAVIEMLRNSSGRSFSLEMLVEKWMADPDFAAHARTMVVKDTKLFQEVCRKAKIEPTLLEELAELRANISV